VTRVWNFLRKNFKNSNSYEVEGEIAVVLIVPASHDYENCWLLLIALLNAIGTGLNLDELPHGLEVLDGLDMNPPIVLVCGEQLRLEVHETELSVAVLIYYHLKVIKRSLTRVLKSSARLRKTSSLPR